jgi:hypothetical protein
VGSHGTEELPVSWADAAALVSAGGVLVSECGAEDMGAHLFRDIISAVERLSLVT